MAKIDKKKGGSKPLTDEETRSIDRAARARRASPPRDPTGEHHVACAAIAREAGVDPSTVLDDWDEAAATKEYESGITRADAERQAVEVVRERYLRQKGLGI